MEAGGKNRDMVDGGGRDEVEAGGGEAAGVEVGGRRFQGTRRLSQEIGRAHV